MKTSAEKIAWLREQIDKSLDSEDKVLADGICDDLETLRILEDKGEGQLLATLQTVKRFRVEGEITRNRGYPTGVGLRRVADKNGPYVKWEDIDKHLQFEEDK